MRVVRSIEEECIAYYDWGWVSRIFRCEERHIALLNATELPPVEVADLHTRATTEDEVDVMNTCYRSADIDHFLLPFLPTTSVRHFETCDGLTSEAVNAYFNGTTSQGTSHASREGAGHFLSEVHSLHFDIVITMRFVKDMFGIASMSRGDIHTRLFAPCGLDASRESHCLSLHTLVWIQRADRFYTLVGGLDGREGTIWIELEFFHSNTATETATTRELARVIEEVVVTLEALIAAVVSE